MQNNTFFGYNSSYAIIVLDKISSTNDYSKNLLTNFKPQLPFTAIMAKNQTHGRGQRGANWETTPNQNLTVSYIYLPTNLHIEEQFQLNLIASLAIYDVIKTYIPKGLCIKWPNDIMVNNKKLGGVLIENKLSHKQIRHSIIGIGINVYTTIFAPAIEHTATSIQLENPTFELPILDLAKQIQRRLDYYDLQLKNNNTAYLWQLYGERLFRKNLVSKFIIEDKEVEAMVVDVSRKGLLLVKLNGIIKEFDLKTIKFIL